MSTIGVVLSGCGVYDGAEIYESTLTLLSLDRLGHTSRCMAPNTAQMHVVDHRNGEEIPETRFVLTEASRLARGEITDMAEVQAEELDALVFPGGFGAAKNLCDFAITGANCTVHPEVERLINAMHEAGKPMAFLCIAPALAAAVLGKKGVSLTIGNDAETAEALEKLGAKHCACTVTEFTVDEANRIVSTPAYMLGKSISEVAEGIDKTMRALHEMLG